MDETEKKPKKLTPASVLKKYGLTATELDELLDQIYTESENGEENNETEE